MKSQLPKKKSRWRILDRWLFSNLPLDPTALMRKIETSWTNFIPSMCSLSTISSLITALHTYLLKGMSLYQRMIASGSPPILLATSDGRLFGFLPYRTGIAHAFCRDAIVGPCPHLSQTRNRTLSGCHRQLGRQSQCSSS